MGTDSLLEPLVEVRGTAAFGASSLVSPPEADAFV